MFRFLFSLLALMPFATSASPPGEIPQELRKAFTLNDEIPVSYWHIGAPIHHTAKLDFFIPKAKNRQWCYNGEVDGFIFQALDDLAREIKGKEICLIGSCNWYAAILLSYGAHPVAIDFSAAPAKEAQITYFTREEFAKNPRKFDLIVSVSSLALEGLGRQGEPLYPEGDLWMMAQFKHLLNPGGKVLLTVPVGPDALVWNAYRIYGEKRLRTLFKGWKPIRYYGFKREFLHRNPGYFYQPAFLLTPR